MGLTGKYSIFVKLTNHKYTGAMNKFFATALLLIISVTTAVTISAQSKISGVGRMELAKYKQARAERIRTLGVDDADTCRIPVTGAIVALVQGYDAAYLTAEGFDVTADFGTTALVRLPISEIESLAGLEGVRSLSFGGKKRMKLNYARQSSTVDVAHSAITHNGSTKSFTGNGVIVGLMDTGLDPNHINFNNQDGTSRVKKLWHFDSYDGSCLEYTDATIRQFTTDDSTETHATHVAGIMAGSYNGTGTFAHIDSPDGKTVSQNTGNIPYYGVATGADLAMSCGELYDDNILQGLHNIVTYAKAQGKPAAINLSLGNNGGPHDGSDEFSQTLAEIGKDAIVCISSGNEGDLNMSLRKTFTATDKSVKTFVIYNQDLGAAMIDGNIDIWASDERPLTVTLHNFTVSGSISTKILQTTKAGQSLNTTGLKAKFQSGIIKMESNIDVNNGRYNVLIDCTNIKTSGNRLVVEVSGAAGQTVDMYFDAGNSVCEFSDNTMSPSTSTRSGYTAGTPDQSINGMACGDNVIAVGAYTSRSTWGDLDGYSASFSESTGTHTSFSSYGTDTYGNTLPHVCAPGSALVSSYSRRYVAQGYEYETASDMTASARNGSTTDYWGAMQGTSMACPFMTGTVALWLEADPTLTHSDILDVLEHSSASDTYTEAAPMRFGYGKLDAAQGLNYILQRTAAIGAISPDPAQGFVITSSRTEQRVAHPDISTFTLYLSDTQGRTVATAHTDHGTAAIATSGMSRGIYILTVTSDSASKSIKIVL